MTVQTTRREFLQWSAMAIAVPWTPWQAAAQRTLKVSTIAGTGTPGAAEDGASADGAPINNPYGLVIGPDGALYWADLGSHRVLSLNLANRKISVVAGNGMSGYSGDGGPAKSARLFSPHEVRFDSKGDVYVAERDNHVVRKIQMKSGTISTFAGIGNMRGFSGDGGPADKAQLAQPHSIALDASDNVYICDIGNNRVRRVDGNTGVITTFLGTGAVTPTPDDAPLANTPTRGPRSIDIDPKTGVMFLILREGNAVFAVDPTAGRMKRIAGTGELGYSGDGGPALIAKFGAPPSALNGPKGIGYAADRSLYITDTENHVIRKIDANGIISTVLGTGKLGDGPDGNPAGCKLNRPHGVFVIGQKIYIGDSENHRIRLLE